jgi:hypothetical protein
MNCASPLAHDHLVPQENGAGLGISNVSFIIIAFVRWNLMMFDTIYNLSVTTCPFTLPHLPPVANINLVFIIKYGRTTY